MTFPRQKTKIVCTIGPSSQQTSVIKRMIRAGMGVARLNFSHGTLDQHTRDIRTIRAAAAELDTDITILADLPGPKIRIGTLPVEPVLLQKNAMVTLTTERDPSPDKIPVMYEGLQESVRPGSPVYVSDGSILLKVVTVSGKNVQCRVVIGGSLLSHKGINLPGAPILLEPVSQKELDLVRFGVENGVSVFSISFVERPADIVKVKEYARTLGREVSAIAKIERSRAVDNIDSILRAADGIMVARGDLGVETPIEEVPEVQKRLIRKANVLCKPVITATQMLLSMTENTRPTRAEATDVANAILDGTDAVMLSEETATGLYPVQTVAMMSRIAASAEKQRKDPSHSAPVWERRKSDKGQISDILSLAVYDTARAAEPRFIVTPTLTGDTARRISRFRTASWILSFSPSPDVAAFLRLSYGVHPFVLATNNTDWHETVVQFLKEKGLGRKGDVVILTHGQFSPGQRTTDSLSIFTLP
jgi:pyruvate kinase